MKKLFNLLMIALCVFATACSDDDDPKPVPLSVNPAELTFAVEGGSQEVTLSLAGAIASPDKDWCTAVVTESKAKITVTANEETQIRTAKVTFTVGEQKVNVTVTQSGKEVVAEELTPEKTEVNFEAAGGEEAVKVTATAAFTAESSETWLTATAAADKVTLKAAANTGEARSAKVTLKMGEKMAEITVNQAKGAPEEVNYNSYIGTWKVKGTGSTAEQQNEYTVIITAKEQGKTYDVAGWCGNAVVQAYPFEMEYQSDGSILVKGHQELATVGEGDTRSVVVVAGVIPVNGGYSLIKSAEIESGKTKGYTAFVGKYNGTELKMIGQEVTLTGGAKYTFGALKYYLYQFNPDPEKVGFYSLKEDDGYAWDVVMTKISNNTSSMSVRHDGFPTIGEFANSALAY